MVLQDKILNVSDSDFESLALEVFAFQAANNPVYSEYLSLLHVHPAEVRTLEDIPFLPMETWKHRELKSGDWMPEIEFRSSGTTGSRPSRHLVASLNWYHRVAVHCFERFYGPVGDYEWISLVPDPSERPDSSLVSMFGHFCASSGDRQQCVSYLNDFQALYQRLEKPSDSGKKRILLGLSFALLDFAESFIVRDPQLLVMETGGMKSTRRQIPKEELLKGLRSGFPDSGLHSEYGMTELMSQAYSADGLHYRSPSHMKFLLTDPEDPFARMGTGKRGIINIVDLANWSTSAFLQTGD
ncbi:MAG TPA: acyl transferase, partial [Saprospiraceae bacterium]|nr:acyl transferase [Saprospiraceae bacterium]